MTGRERVYGLLAGESVSPKVNLAIDAAIRTDLDKGWPAGDLFRLVEIPNPFCLGRRQGIDLNDVLSHDPGLGGSTLDDLMDQIKSMIDEADGDGIYYRLEGASPFESTPMQYGGYYLERDRELLDYAMSKTKVVLSVLGGEGTYLDFVSDLPANVFCWDSGATGFSADSMRTLRTGLLCSNDPQSDLEGLHPALAAS